MKKVALLLILTLKLSAQQCKATYNVVPTFETLETITNAKPENLNFLKKFVTGADETLRQMTYVLLIRNQETSFEIDKKSLPPNPNYYALSAAGQDAYYNKSDTIWRIKKLGSEKFAIIINKTNNWQLTNESKTINGYVCYKAKIKQISRTNVQVGQTETYDVIAWYCPKIPLKFGPKRFGNLPGLILELQDNKVTFIIKTLELDAVSDLKNNFFSKYTIITEDKYYEQVARMTEAFGH